MADDAVDPTAETEAAAAGADDEAVEAGVVDEAEAPAETPAEAEGEAPAPTGKAGAKAAPGAKATAKAKGTTEAKPESTVVRKKVTSKRVTPKGAPQGKKITPPKGSTPARTKGDDGEDLGFSSRYVAPDPVYAKGPSPWWVPAIMFGLLIIGALIIMLNYMSAFGDPENVRLVIGLAFILGGIIAATQYR